MTDCGFIRKVIGRDIDCCGSCHDEMVMWDDYMPQSINAPFDYKDEHPLCVCCAFFGALTEEDWKKIYEAKKWEIKTRY